MTIHEWTKAKYPTASPEALVALEGIERFNPALPVNVLFEDEPMTNERLFRMRNTAAQIKVTGGKLAEGVDALLWGER